MESPEQYKARILALVESKDAVTVQRETADQLAKLIAGIPAEKLRQRPASDKWSIAEILAHLSEAEIGSSWRYRQMIEHDGAPLSSYDQDLWESLGDYSSRSAEESLQLFRLLREANLRLFDRLSPEQWQHFGVHAERGRMSVADLARQVAGHDINHLEQIRKVATQ
ncbi:MAG TPA: DinB family protein [Terriglobales bacterium]